MTETTAAASGDADAGSGKPLDDIMLAMDVVDTLRRRERMVTRELGEDGREADLTERLRKTYAAQGIDVPDHILKEGVQALRQERFVYKPAGPGLGRSLANLYVSRNRWGKWVLGGLAVVIAAILVNYYVFVVPRGALPGDLAAAHADVAAIAQVDEAKATADRLLAAGEDAIRKGDAGAAERALDTLRNLRTTLEQEYTLFIVNRPGHRTGVWRVPDVNPQARNYYIIVQALNDSGQIVPVPIMNEETGKVEMVKMWGLRVDQAVYDRIARDKGDDGIIQNDRFGSKSRGQMTPDYAIPTTGAAITDW